LPFSSGEDVELDLEGEGIAIRVVTNKLWLLSCSETIDGDGRGVVGVCTVVSVDADRFAWNRFSSESEEELPILRCGGIDGGGGITISADNGY